MTQMRYITVCDNTRTVRPGDFFRSLFIGFANIDVVMLTLCQLVAPADTLCKQFTEVDLKCLV